jgi:hypothetical protein
VIESGECAEPVSPLYRIETAEQQLPGYPTELSNCSVVRLDADIFDKWGNDSS